RLERAAPITIGDNVWLGGGVTVLPGVSIGDGSVIGASAVVTRDVPAHTVAVGSPARVLRELWCRRRRSAPRTDPVTGRQPRAAGPLLQSAGRKSPPRTGSAHHAPYRLLRALLRRSLRGRGRCRLRGARRRHRRRGRPDLEVLDRGSG